MTRADLIFAAGLVGALAVLGIVAGVLWSAISPHSDGFVVSTSSVIPGETEGFVAADGRFLIITAVIGLVAGAVTWGMRRYRGPVAVTALGLGGTLGATITALVGHALSSGRSTGAQYATIRLPITLHAHSLVAVEGGLALVAYLIGTLFIAADDLGRSAHPAEPDSPVPGDGSVGAGSDAQGLGRYGNGPGVSQNGQFAS